MVKDAMKLPGWCYLAKAERLYSLLVSRGVKLSVELGVYGGRSLVPQALAMKKTGGLAVGVDPWSHEEALQPGLLDTAPSQEEFDALYAGVVEAVRELPCKLIRATAETASYQLKDIEFLHIDGNHTEGAVLKDFRTYYPLVKSGGLIWFDDADWPTIQAAINEAKELMDVFEQFDVRNVVLIKR